MRQNKVSLIILSILILVPLLLTAQKNSSKTSFKTAAEFGLVDIELFGEGLVQRLIFKVDNKMRFKSSYLEFKLNTRSELYGLDNSLGAAKVIGQIDYLFNINKDNVLSFSLLSDNNYVDVFEKYNQKLFHIYARGIYLYNISSLYAVQVSGQNSHSQLIYDKDGYLSVNSVGSAFIYKPQNLGKISLGVVLSDLSLIQNTDNVNRLRFGIDTEYSYRNKMIIGLTLRLFRYYDDQLINQQVKFIAGRYFAEDFSLFVMANLIRSGVETENDAYALLVNRMEQYNSASLKLGYDYSRTILLYIKAHYQDQNILESDFVIASGQVLFGTQYKF